MVKRITIYLSLDSDNFLVEADNSGPRKAKTSYQEVVGWCGARLRERGGRCTPQEGDTDTFLHEGEEYELDRTYYFRS
jgi:hypothetical protein